MSWWTPEFWEIQSLKNTALYSWDRDTRKKTVDALVSYRKTALPALIDIASAIWDKELREYVLDKIREINEGSVR